MTQVVSLVNAFDAFISGCKLDNTWNSIKASCIMAGWSNLSGALTPLAGVAPSGFNLASGQYSRASGLKGDGVSMYLSSNRNNNADPQNNKHVAVFPTIASTGGNYFNSGAGGVTGRTGLGFALSAPNETTAQTSINNASPFDAVGNISGAAVADKLMGLSRIVSSSFVARFNSSSTTVNLISATPNNGNISIFARPATPVDQFSSSRLSFYSIGESLDLALLDNRVTVLMSGIQNAIS